MDIRKMVDNFDVSSKAYRILVITAVVLMILALLIKNRINQNELSPLTDTVPSKTEMIMQP